MNPRNFRISAIARIAAFATCTTAFGTQHAPNPSPEDPALADRIISPMIALGEYGGHGTLASLASDAFDRLPPASIRIRGFPLGMNRNVDLDLVSFQVTGPGAAIVEGTDAGDVPMPMPHVTLFRGTVADAPDSWVFLGVTPDRINGIIHLSDDEEFIIAPRIERIAAGAPDTHVIYDRFRLTAGPPSSFRCSAVPRPGDPSKNPSSIGFQPADRARELDPRSTPDHVAWIALDCDWEFRNLAAFSSSSEAAAYAITLIGVVHVIYERDVQTRMYVNYVRVWNTPSDPYDADDTEEQLPEFENYFSGSPGSSVSRELNHLLSGRDLGGGRGFIDVLCDAYAISANLRGSFPDPSPQDFHPDNWDIIVVAHEMGHNFGSPHTHCYDPPIDTCAGTLYDCSHPRVCQQGELMSYCHTCPGGKANIKLAFQHPAVRAEMREDVDCLRNILSTVYLNASWTGGENGTVALPYNKVIEGFMGVSEGGTMRLLAGSYPAAVRLDRAVRLENWTGSGTVTIGH